MRNRVKIYHGILVLFLILLILRFNAILGGVQLLYYFVLELFIPNNSLINKTDIITFDYLNSILFFFIIPILIFIYRNKIKIFNSKLTISIFVFLILIFSVIFSPLITAFHPNAQSDIRIARFLPPLSTIRVIQKTNEEKGSAFEKIQKRVINRETIVSEKYVSTLNKKNETNSENVSTKLFILGTDELGRDIFARVVYGARVSLFIAFFTVIISLLIGVMLGFIAAKQGGLLNTVFSRVADMFLAIPSIFFVIMILAFWGNSITAVIVVLGVTGWMSIFKVVKVEIASIVEKDYFITSKKLGFSFWQLLFREILPILIIPLTVAVVFQFSNVILAESALSFLGLGVGINYPSWGNMILSGQKYMTSAWWMLVIPSVILTTVLLSVNSFGEKIKRKINPTIKND